MEDPTNSSSISLPTIPISSSFNPASPKKLDGRDRDHDSDGGGVGGGVDKNATVRASPPRQVGGARFGGGGGGGGGDGAGLSSDVWAEREGSGNVGLGGGGGAPGGSSGKVKNRGGLGGKGIRAVASESWDDDFLFQHSSTSDLNLPHHQPQESPTRSQSSSSRRIGRSSSPVQQCKNRQHHHKQSNSISYPLGGGAVGSSSSSVSVVGTANSNTRSRSSTNSGSSNRTSMISDGGGGGGVGSGSGRRRWSNARKENYSRQNLSSASNSMTSLALRLGGVGAGGGGPGEDFTTTDEEGDGDCLQLGGPGPSFLGRRSVLGGSGADADLGNWDDSPRKASSIVSGVSGSRVSLWSVDTNPAWDPREGEGEDTITPSTRQIGLGNGNGNGNGNGSPGGGVKGRSSLVVAAGGNEESVSASSASSRSRSPFSGFGFGGWGRKSNGNGNAGTPVTALDNSSRSSLSLTRDGADAFGEVDSSLDKIVGGGRGAGGPSSPKRSSSSRPWSSTVSSASSMATGISRRPSVSTTATTDVSVSPPGSQGGSKGGLGGGGSGSGQSQYDPNSWRSRRTKTPSLTSDADASLEDEDNVETEDEWNFWNSSGVHHHHHGGSRGGGKKTRPRLPEIGVGGGAGEGEGEGQGIWGGGSSKTPTLPTSNTSNTIRPELLEGATIIPLRASRIRSSGSNIHQQPPQHQHQHQQQQHLHHQQARSPEDLTSAGFDAAAKRNRSRTTSSQTTSVGLRHQSSAHQVNERTPKANQGPNHQQQGEMGDQNQEAHGQGLRKYDSRATISTTTTNSVPTTSASESETTGTETDLHVPVGFNRVIQEGPRVLHYDDPNASTASLDPAADTQEAVESPAAVKRKRRKLKKKTRPHSQSISQSRPPTADQLGKGLSSPGGSSRKGLLSPALSGEAEDGGGGGGRRSRSTTQSSGFSSASGYGSGDASEGEGRAFGLGLAFAEDSGGEGGMMRRKSIVEAVSGSLASTRNSVADLDRGSIPFPNSSAVGGPSNSKRASRSNVDEVQPTVQAKPKGPLSFTGLMSKSTSSLVKPSGLQSSPEAVRKSPSAANIKMRQAFQKAQQQQAAEQALPTAAPTVPKSVPAVEPLGPGVRRKPGHRHSSSVSALPGVSSIMSSFQFGGRTRASSKAPQPTSDDVRPPSVTSFQSNSTLRGEYPGSSAAPPDRRSSIFGGNNPVTRSDSERTALATAAAGDGSTTTSANGPRRSGSIISRHNSIRSTSSSAMNVNSPHGSISTHRRRIPSISNAFKPFVTSTANFFSPNKPSQGENQDPRPPSRAHSITHERPRTADPDTQSKRGAYYLAGEGKSSSGSSLSQGPSGTLSLGRASGGSLIRRNSLSDLRIPTRITNAQARIGQDLGRVKEFAKGVEELKALRITYQSLVASAEASSSQRNSSEASDSSEPAVTGQAPAGEASGRSGQDLNKLQTEYAIWWECADVLVTLGEGSSTGEGKADSPAMSASRRDRCVSMMPMSSTSSIRTTHGSTPPLPSLPDFIRPTETASASSSSGPGFDLDLLDVASMSADERQIQILRGMLSPAESKETSPEAVRVDSERSKRPLSIVQEPRHSPPTQMGAPFPDQAEPSSGEGAHMPPATSPTNQCKIDLVNDSTPTPAPKVKGRLRQVSRASILGFKGFLRNLNPKHRDNLSMAMVSPQGWEVIETEDLQGSPSSRLGIGRPRSKTLDSNRLSTISMTGSALSHAPSSKPKGSRNSDSEEEDWDKHSDSHPSPQFATYPSSSQPSAAVGPSPLYRRSYTTNSVTPITLEGNEGSSRGGSGTPWQLGTKLVLTPDSMPTLLGYMKDVKGKCSECNSALKALRLPG